MSYFTIFITLVLGLSMILSLFSLFGTVATIIFTDLNYLYFYTLNLFRAAIFAHLLLIATLIMNAAKGV